jgi:HEAT repeat protein
MRTTLALLVLTFAAPAPARGPDEPRAAGPDVDIEALIAKAHDLTGGPEAVKQLTDLGPDAVPALTQGLWSDSGTTRRVCAAVLGEIGADARAAGPSLAQVLNDDSKAVRLAAARALGAVAAPAAVPALARALKDESPAVRLAAAGSLIDLGADAKTVLPVLTKSLASGQPDERYFATGLLTALGPEAAPALPALAAALAEADPPLTVRIADTLGRIGPEAKVVIPALKRKLQEDANAELFRVSAAVALWRIDRDAAAADLLRAALTADAALRPHPHAALWRIDRSRKTADALKKELKSADDVAVAIDVLGRYPEDFPEMLVSLSKLDGPDGVRVLGLRARLGPQPKEALEKLRARAKQKQKNDLGAAVEVYRTDPTSDSALAVAAFLENKDARVSAAEALRQLRPTAKAVAIELLVALDSKDEEFRLAAAAALWGIEKSPAALKAAAAVLRSADPKMRQAAALALGVEFGPDATAAVPDLVKRLFDARAAVRAVAAEALGRIGPGAKAAAPALLAVLEGDEPPFVYSAACEALGRIRADDADAVTAALKQKLDHPDPLVRAHAALALALAAGDKSGQDEAVRGLGHRTHAVRITAAEAVWRMNRDGRAVPLLVGALEESNLIGSDGDNERYMAARALGRIGADAKPGVPELLKLIEARNETLATAARAALVLVDPEAAKKAGVK